MTLIWGGLSLGAVYALVAIGYNIVFLSSRTFNFAQAQLMMVGAFVAYTGLVTWKLPAVVVAVLAAAVVFVLTAIEERVAIRPAVDGHHNVLVTTLGASILLDGLVQLIWGNQPLSVPFFGGQEILTVLGGRVYPVELALIAVTVVLVIALVQIGRRFLVGIALVGMSEDREAAMLRGVNVRRLAFVAITISGALAGFLGMFVGPKTFAVATLGASLAIKGFVVLAIGGFGSMPGVLVGGLVVGLAEAMGARYLGGEYANVTVFVILIVILLVRPSGLFGSTAERVV